VAACGFQFVYVLESPAQFEIPDEDGEYKLAFFVGDGLKEANKRETQE
jgi:hypothetical protein